MTTTYILDELKPILRLAVTNENYEIAAKLKALRGNLKLPTCMKEDKPCRHNCSGLCKNSC